MNWVGTKVLVTGGTGFVGAHLVEELVKNGAIVFSTFQQVKPNSYFHKNSLDKKTILANIDVSNFNALFDFITKSDIEYIFHLAAQPIVETAYFNPRKTLETNIMGTVNILEAARLYTKIKGVIVASSDKSYGISEKKEYFESDPLRGTHPYEVSKSSADLISFTYAKTYGLPVVVTRFGNIYGEGDLNLSRIVPGIMYSIIKNIPLELRSDGTFIRDYLYVKDVVAGYLAIADNIKKCVGEAFNFGSQETYSVLELIEIAEKSLKTKINFEIKNNAKNEIPYQSLNYDKAKKMISWKPRTTVAKSLPKIITYYQAVL